MVIQQVVFLFPQFCIMTGFGQELNENLRREVSSMGAKDANEKVRKLMDLRKLLQENLLQMNPKEMKNKLGIRISR